MTKNAPAAPSFPTRANGNEVRMLTQGPGFGLVIETHTGADGKRRKVAELGTIESHRDGWMTHGPGGSDCQLHDTQYDALARFAS